MSNSSSCAHTAGTERGTKEHGIPQRFVELADANAREHGKMHEPKHRQQHLFSSAATLCDNVPLPTLSGLRMCNLHIDCAQLNERNSRERGTKWISDALFSDSSVAGCTDSDVFRKSNVFAGNDHLTRAHPKPNDIEFIHNIALIYRLS